MPMVRSFGSLLAALWLLTAGLRAQEYTFRVYNQDDGLPNLSLNALLQDRKGFLWIGSEAGLIRYDGSQFRQYGREAGLPGLIVISLAEDPFGHVWACTSDGLAYQSGNQFQTLKLGGRDLRCDYGAQLSAGANGHLYAATTQGLMEIASPDSGRSWTASPFYPDLQVRDNHSVFPAGVLALRDGSQLFGCGLNLCSTGPGSLQRLGPAQGVPPDQWTKLYQDRAGRVWVRGARHFLVSEPNSRLQFRSVDLPGGARQGQCSDIVEDRTGRILVCTDAAPVARFSEGRWELLGPANGLVHGRVGSLLATDDGQIWLGLEGKGLSKWLGYGAWEHATQRQGLAGTLVWSMLVDRQHQVWVADDAGLTVSSDGGRTFRKVGVGIPGTFTGRSLVQTDSGEVWFADRLGKVVVLDPGSRKVLERFKFPPCRRLAVDRSNQVWLSTWSGLYVGSKNNGHWSFRLLIDGQASNQRFIDVVKGEGSDMWVATSSGILRCRNEHCDKLTGTEKAGTRFSDVLWAQGSLWGVGNFAGLARFRLAGLSVRSVEITRAPQLRSDQLVFIGKDGHDRLWVGGDSGVDVFDGGHWRGFNDREGLLWNDCDGQAFFAGTDDVWIGTSMGLSHLNYRALT